ncbi:FAD-binding oxidoreductase (plasmid) [Peteryoungia desertarenae]|uniref:FAD-binding oxidoreductase n=1 Tax=Peteryoungia desertarenae TaxID=1813451 RepID=A0ABX6QUD2_9HYPH|nr:FAD-binding oxidoreductase [Peteryoungia desertarenae]QLF71805.1 FAD-binding oxidoreductase [Peteryoungia desertarenae]
MTRHLAERLPARLGPAAWNDILGPQSLPEPLQEDHVADFVIIGGGFAGLSAARRLRQLQPNARLAVLEAARLAEGSAGRNSGFMIDLPHELRSDDYAGNGDDKGIIALNRKAIAFAGEAVEEYGIDQNFFDRAGKVNGAVSAIADARNRSYAAHLATLGEASELLGPEQMREMTGSSHYVSGLYTPGTVMLQPAGYIRGLGAGLQAQGVRIFENSPVVGFEREGAGWRVRTTKGSISTGRVIVTVNGHLESFGFERGRLMQLFLFAVMTPELDSASISRLGGRPRWGITPSDPMGTTVRRIDTAQGGNRIVTRTCAVLRSNCVVRPSDLTRAARIMQRKFDVRFPQLAGMAMEYSWSGHLCLTMNGVAVARQLEDGIYSGCIQNGLGTVRGTLTGIAAAELACGETSMITSHFTREPRPTRLPPQPLREIGANLVLRWKEWKAREE